MPERPPDPALEESTNKWMRWGLILMVIMVLAFPIYRITEPDRRADAADDRVAVARSWTKSGAIRTAP